MPEKKESLEETIRRVLGEERQKQEADSELADLLKKNPVEGIRSIFRSEIDAARTRDVEAEEKAPRRSREDGSDDEENEGGLFQAIIGGRK